MRVLLHFCFVSLLILLNFSFQDDCVVYRRRELFVAPAVSLLNNSRAEFDTSKVSKLCRLHFM